MTSDRSSRRSWISLGATFFAAIALAAATPVRASASTLALDVNGGSNAFCNSPVGCVVGWGFHVNSPIEVSSLGFFDIGGDGLADPHAVGIFDSVGTLIASTVITNASTPTPSAYGGGRWLMNAISPINLFGGDYSIGAVDLYL